MIDKSLFLLIKAPKEALAQSVLAEVPQQVVNYFSTFKLQPPKSPIGKQDGSWTRDAKGQAAHPCTTWFCNTDQQWWTRGTSIGCIQAIYLLTCGCQRYRFVLTVHCGSDWIRVLDSHEQMRASGRAELVISSFLSFTMVHRTKHSDLSLVMQYDGRGFGLLLKCFCCSHLELYRRPTLHRLCNNAIVCQTFSREVARLGQCTS